MFKEEFGDIWKMEGDALCITTNGFVRNDGSLAMGRGIARQARQLFPKFEFKAGKLVRDNGNIVQSVVWDSKYNRYILIFPVKHKWWEKADLTLIQQSCNQLMTIAEDEAFEKILLPRPGCGNGGLRWEQVKPAIKDLLDERIIVVHYVVPVVYNA